MEPVNEVLLEKDYFTDREVLLEPYPYFEMLREKGPVYRDPTSGVVFITGFQELIEVANNTRDFSAVNGPLGPNQPLPFTPEGPDITAQIEANRDQIYGGQLLLSYDDEKHSKARSLITRLFTPSRLRSNEQYIVEKSDEFIKAAVSRGGCDLITEISTPLITLVIADLLGVPDQDRLAFSEVLAAATPTGSIDGNDRESEIAPMAFMGRYFYEYLATRRANPQGDILSELANGTYPDGTLPELTELVSLAIVLFGAGQDTSAKLLGTVLRYIVDEPNLQDQLRSDTGLIPGMIEEILRIEGSTKTTARLARRDTQVGGVVIPAGSRLLLSLAGANRDPRRWEDPTAFRIGRPRIKEHVAFNRGPHTCAGAPLARLEVRIMIEKFLEHTNHIDIDESKHGPRSARRFEFEPTFVLRGLKHLYLKLS